MLQESNRVELKANLNDKLEKEIVAFLNNHEGGVLYIGVDDAGNPIQLPDLDSLQLKIADRIKNNILPSCQLFFTRSLAIFRNCGKRIPIIFIFSLSIFLGNNFCTN